MDKKIITISREFGSGGRTIGRMVAERLGIPFYDKELVEQIALESGFAEKSFQHRRRQLFKITTAADIDRMQFFHPDFADTVKLLYRQSIQKCRSFFRGYQSQTVRLAVIRCRFRQKFIE